MSETASIKVPSTFAQAWRKLPPEQQNTVIDMTQRLASEEEQRIKAEVQDEADWAERFADPEKAARFLAWGKQALEGPGDEPLDLKRL